MSRRRRVVFVVVAGLVAGAIGHFVAPDTSAGALCLLGAGVVLGELLVLRLEDGGAIPLSYAVLMVIASSFSFEQFAITVLAAEAIALPLRDRDHNASWRLRILVDRLAVAAATFGAYSLAARALDERETVAAVLATLAASAAAQVVTDAVIRKALRLGSTFSARGRLAWLAIASSGMLMAIGYRGVDGDGRIGIWGPLLFATPLLAAWYAFERLDAATRAYRQTIEALAMAPELGGLVPPGHAQRVATLAGAMGEELGLSAPDVRDLEMAALLHHLGQVTLDAPEEDDNAGTQQREVAEVTSSMMRDIRPLAAAGDIVAGDTDEPKRRLAAQVLRIASEYDDLTVRDNTPGEIAIESLRTAPTFVYDARVVGALEHVLHDRVTRS